MQLTLKSVFIVLFLSIIVNVLAQCPNNMHQQPTINTIGQILYFPFNGNATNMGSGSYSASVNGPTYVNGICGQAAHFDGVDDYIKITPYVPLMGDYTIATWVYVDSLTTNLAVFATRDQCTSTYRGYSQGELGINYYNNTAGGPNKIRYVINKHQNCTGWSLGERYYANNYTYASGSWHFIALRVQNNISNSRTVEFFVDCQLLSSTKYNSTDVSGAFSSTNHKSFIGAASEILPWMYSFNGIIDEFRLFNRFLSDEEIYTLYEQCKTLDMAVNEYNIACQGDSLVIEVLNTQPNVSYQLYDSTNQVLVGSSLAGGCNSLFFNTGLITVPTGFTVKAISSTSSCSIILDTLILINPIIGYTQAYDTVSICFGDSVLINGTYYSGPNTIIDTIPMVSGCDSIVNTTVENVQLLNLDLGPDQIICENDSMLLSVANYSSILWNTGSTSNSIWANNIGSYWVVVADSGCVASDTVELMLQNIDSIKISDQSACIGDGLPLSLPSSNQYLWWDNSTSNLILISDSGEFWVQITDACKTYTDTFTVKLKDCNCAIYIPNVFTPNNDGLNDNFYAVMQCELSEYEMFIFNRWGRVIFQSTDQTEVWDGRYNGVEVTDGVYFYRMNFLNTYSGKMDYKTGSLTILR